MAPAVIEGKGKGGVGSMWITSGSTRPGAKEGGIGVGSTRIRS
jgi:hypothetical protein